LNATKLERVFAKPFIGALDGHRDGVNCMCKHPTSLSFLLSGACDGEVTSNSSIIIWILQHFDACLCSDFGLFCILTQSLQQLELRNTVEIYI
jgi:hypothetical protein